MIIKQLTIFIENKSGRLAEVTKVLGENNINISALSVADTSEYGLIRLIVSDGEKAVKLLKKSEFSVNLTDVICLSVAHKPGALHDAIEILSEANVGIEYMYAYALGNKAAVIMKVSDPKEAIYVLTEKDIELLKADDVYK
ncbi:MAG: acetolactate synthase [Firmicutes bacterium HGW-Firmicutes-7]|nr:MAG: acetolactate synthase [Firmicutes bacterium HGW-Firmicutes-7]